MDHDPKGTFVRKWWPELKDVPDDFLAQPHMLPVAAQKKYNCIIGEDYPSISVDLLQSSKFARDKIYNIILFLQDFCVSFDHYNLSY